MNSLSLIFRNRYVQQNETLQQKLAEATFEPPVTAQVTSEISLTAPKAPPESLLKAMDASRQWLESMETALASEFSVTLAPQLHDQLNKFKVLCLALTFTGVVV